MTPDNKAAREAAIKYEETHIAAWFSTRNAFLAGAAWQRVQWAEENPGANVLLAKLKLLADQNRKLQKALENIVEGDWKFHQERGAIDGPFANIARVALKETSDEDLG